MVDNYANINNYEFKKTIGEGNFAKVKLSIYKPTNEEFAIKIINKAILKQKMKNTIFRETKIISKLKHPNIITVFQIIEDIDNYYIIMENCKKGELFDYIVENKYLSENEASVFFYQLINGVEYIHSQNLVHRDLKPENLLLTENKIIKIIDFGLSRPFDGTIFLKTKCGSPSYAAPEIIQGDEYDGFKTDIWCCGVILYAMLCGFLPFGGENDTELFKSILECNPEMPNELSRESKKLIKNIFTNNPKKRISIPEIKRTQFYLKGKKLFNIKYENINEDNKNLDFIKDYSINLEDNENEKKENNNHKSKDNVNKNNISMDEGNNKNFEEITIVSNEEDEDSFINNKQKNNINIFDINKIKVAKALNLKILNINNRDSKENKNDIKEFDNKKNTIFLHTLGNLEESEIQKNKLQLNFNTLKNNYNNNQIYNSFRKKLLNKDIAQKLKQKFENIQKIMKSETKEFKNDINKKQFNSKQENKINNFNQINDNNTNAININTIIKNNRNQSNKQIILTIPNIKDKVLNDKKKKKLKLKLDNYNIIKTIQKSKKLILGKSPNQNIHNIKYLLTNNNEIKNIQSTSFKRFIDNLNFGKISVKSLSNKRTIFNNSNNLKSDNKENRNSNKINVKKIYINSHQKNSKSLEAKKINNIYHKIGINKKKFISPWKAFKKKIITNEKLTPSAYSVKKNSNIRKIIHTTPKRKGLLYNNISININTININENRIHQLKLSEKTGNKKKLNEILSERKHSITNKSKINNIKINFSKIINKTKNKNNLYSNDLRRNMKAIGKSLGHNININELDLFLIKNGNTQKNFENNKLSKNIITIKGSPSSEQNKKDISMVHNNIYTAINIAKK